MRIRSIKPEWLEDEKLAECSSDARVVSVALLLLADDVGRGRLGKATAARVFPSDPAAFSAALDELSPWYVRKYSVRGQSYFEVLNWAKHQKIDRPSKPITPEPSEDTREPSMSPRRILDADRDLDLEGKKDQERDYGRARGEHSPCRIGNEFMLAVNGSLTWDYSSWRRELEVIGEKPETQRTIAIETIRSSVWCRTNAQAVHPGHVVKYWNRYASGKEAVTQVVPKRGPSAVPTQSDYAADAAMGDSAWET